MYETSIVMRSHQNRAIKRKHCKNACIAPLTMTWHVIEVNYNDCSQNGHIRNYVDITQWRKPRQRQLTKNRSFNSSLHNNHREQSCKIT